jgi:hypothetical protein
MSDLIGRLVAMAEQDGTASQNEGDLLREAAAEIERLTAERDEYKCEMESAFKLTQKQAKILTDTINALKGEPPELVSWSHHDVAEHARRVVAERDEAREAAQHFRNSYGRLYVNDKPDTEYWPWLKEGNDG